MTAKRFTFTQDTLAKADVFDGNEFVCCTLSVWVEQLVDLLNQLNNENEELKSELQDKRLGINLFNAENTSLMEENEQLKKRIDRIDIILDDLNGAEYISRDDAIKALNKIDKVVR